MRGRILVDEMFPREVARRLTDLGHDAVSVHDVCPGQPDPAAWALAAKDHRAILTENAADFRPLLSNAAAGVGQLLPLLLIHRSRLPRGKALPAGLAERVDTFLADLDHLPETEWWL